MLEAAQDALAWPGIHWVLLVCFVSGVVYGFAGFGSALIFMPVAVAVLPVEVAVGAFSLSALASLFTIVPSAWGAADRPGAMRMIAAAVVTTPIGIWMLRTFETDWLRAAISVIVLVTLGALISGFRLPLRPGPRADVGIGAAAGVTGGATGLNGPVVILFNMGAGLSAVQVRANTAVFLTISSLSFLPQLWLQGLMSGATLVLGLVLLPLYGAGTWIGKGIFRPEREKVYRVTAYLIIAAAGLAGLPIWGT